MFRFALFPVVRLLRRLHPRRIRWGVLFSLGFLAALAWALFLLLPPAPRWSVHGHYWIQGFTPDHKVVVTCTAILNPDKDEPTLRKFTWWDVDTGNALRSVETVCSYHVFSSDYRHVAAGSGGKFWILAANSAKEIPVEGEWTYQRWPESNCRFAPSGRVLARTEYHRDRNNSTLSIIDTTTGATRSRQAGVVNVYGFLPDSDELLYSHADKENWFINVRDTSADQRVRTYGPYHGLLGQSSGSRYFVASVKSRSGIAVDVIDLRQNRVTLQLPEGGRDFRHFMFSREERTLAVWRHDSRHENWHVEFWDLETRKKLSTAVLSRDCNHGMFSPDGAKFAAGFDSLFDIGSSIRMPPHPVQVLEVATGRELWRNKSDRGNTRVMSFTRHASCLHVDLDHQQQFLDANTGAVDQSLSCFLESGFLFTTEANAFSIPGLTSDERYLIAARYRAKKSVCVPWLGWQSGGSVADEIAVVDVEGQQVICRLRLDECASFRFCDRGPRLITSHRSGDDWRLVAWDIPLRRPWLMIVGIPAATGLTLMGLRFGYRRRKAPLMPLLTKNP